MDVLDSVVGPGNWQDEAFEVKGNLYYRIGILINDIWVWKSNCGSESNIEKEKGESSDSFKRAAVKWGIGRFLYDLEIVTLPTATYSKNNKEYPSIVKGDQSKILWDGKQLNDWINGEIENNKANERHKQEAMDKEPPKQPKKGSNKLKELINVTKEFDFDGLMASAKKVDNPKELKEFRDKLNADKPPLTQEQSVQLREFIATLDELFQ